MAALYASVGHGGASGYLAIMALLGVSAALMRPSALILNVLVAALATIMFVRAGFFRWQLLWPFLITSIPCAFLAGAYSINEPCCCDTGHRRGTNVHAATRRSHSTAAHSTCGGHRRFDRRPLWFGGNWRWNSAHAADDSVQMGHAARGCCSFCSIHSAQFACGTWRASIYRPRGRTLALVGIRWRHRWRIDWFSLEYSQWITVVASQSAWNRAARCRIQICYHCINRLLRELFACNSSSHR